MSGCAVLKTVLISREGILFDMGVCLQAYGGFIMSASHNPGGPKYDWGIKVRRGGKIVLKCCCVKGILENTRVCVSLFHFFVFHVLLLQCIQVIDTVGFV